MIPFDSGYDFGVVGCLALFVSSCILCRPKWRDLHCGQRRPFDLWRAFFAREDVSLGQRPEMIPVYKDALSLRTDRADRWFLIASENSWTLPFLDRAKLEWQLTPRWAQVKAQLANGEPIDYYALVLNTQLPQDLPIEIVKKYPSSTFIVRILSRGGESS